MNILLVTSSDLCGIGGLASRYHSLSKAIGKLGHKLFFIGVTYRPCHDLNLGRNVHVHPLDMSAIHRLKVDGSANMLWKALWASIFAAKCLRTVVKTCISERINVCMSYAQPVDALVYLLSRLFRSCWIYDSRGLCETELPKLNLVSKSLIPFILSLEIFSSRHADLVLVASEHMRKAILLFRKLEPSKVFVSRDGVDPKSFNPRVPKGIIRSSYQISKDAPVVLYVGSLSLAKGVNNIIRAVPYILKAYSDAKLVIVGGGGYAVDDSIALQSLVKEMNLEASVIFTGRVKHPAPYIVDADVCVAPSSLYYSPIKIYEYLACAKPVVMDKGVDIAELLVTSEAGAVADTIEPSEFAGVILRLIKDQDYSQKISSNGYRITIENFTWETVAAKLIRLIETELIRPT